MCAKFIIPLVQALKDLKYELSRKLIHYEDFIF